MTNRLIQVELDLVLEIQEYIEDHDPHKLESILEADNTIAEFKTCMDRFRRCHTELKLALGEDYRDKYTGRDETRKTFRIYLGDLETRGRALRREKDTRETNERKLEKTLDRAVTEKLEVERAARKITAAAYRLETSATIAQEAMWLDEASTYRDWSIQAIDRAISDAKMHLKEFRMAHLNLSKILGDNYSQEQIINFKAISEETGRKISDLERVLREKDKIRHKSKVTQGEQAVKEIKLRCATLSSILGRSPTKLPDSQLLEANKGLVQINADVSKILDRVTEFAGYVSEIGASDQLDLINQLVTDTLDEKNTYVKSVRDEVEARDLSKEKIRNALGLKIEIPRFCGYDSAMDIYTFREKFEKFVTPYVQKPLLPDTLKMNYLGDPALTLVRELRNLDEIWAQLFKSYGNASVLLVAS